MTLVSNDPSWWPLINANFVGNYFIAAASVIVMYDWALTFGQEAELIWRQPWSLMTFLYLSVRYAGIGHAVMSMLFSVPTISTTDAVSLVISDAINWTSEVVNVILGIVMIARLYAMYQRSRKISAEKFVLSGTYQCIVSYAGDIQLSDIMTWVLGTVWEVLALCLAVWIAVKHFRELRQHSTSGIIGDCFAVLMKTHVSYFASFLAISCFQIGLFSPTLSADVYSLDTQIDNGLSQIFQIVQMFVLGPRLILGVREYHAELVANSDTASIAFQEHDHVSTRSSV
ncbi:hypothetical protein BDR03DRAFT_465611 [Suillus americanus]|nr:hypothetical protein BDR03DRAFT_465611 [Suillus americanus]